MLELLDVHRVLRRDVNRALLATLRDAFVSSIPSLPKARYEIFLLLEKLMLQRADELLLTTFPYIRFEELRAIPLAILDSYQKIPHKYLVQLSQDKELYKVQTGALYLAHTCSCARYRLKDKYG